MPFEPWLHHHLPLSILAQKQKIGSLVPVRMEWICCVLDLHEKEENSDRGLEALWERLWKVLVHLWDRLLVRLSMVQNEVLGMIEHCGYF